MDDSPPVPGDELQGADHATQALVSISVEAPLQRAEHHPAVVYLGQLAPGSRRTMEQALRVVADMLSGGRSTWQTLCWGQIDYSHLAALRQALISRYAPANANKMLCATRGVLKQAFILGQLSAEVHQRAALVQGIHAEVLLAGRALSPGEVRALFAACAEPARPAAGARDAAALALMYGLGLRRAEAVAVQLDQYEVQTGCLSVRRGKGLKDRLCYANGGAAAALAQWQALRGAAPGPLLCPVDRWGRIRLRPMSAQALRQILLRRGRRARVSSFSPHDLRRTFITQLLEADVDLKTVRDMAGHSGIATTARYDRRGEKAKIRAAGLLHVPFVPSDDPGSEGEGR